MKTRILSTLAVLVSVSPLAAIAADLRVGVARYDGGAAIYGLANGQQMICDNCPEAPALVLAPPRTAIRFEPHVEPQALLTLEVPPKERTPTKAKAPLVLPLNVTVYFNFNNARLGSPERKKIRTALAAGADPSVIVRVDGYTCRIGKSAYNRKLSARRAKVVAAYLETLGVKVSSVEGLGKKHPKGGALSKDRRAEIVVKERNYIP